MSDIVARLREDELRLGRAAFDSAEAGLLCNLASDAADEIERLRAELAAERKNAEYQSDCAKECFDQNARLEAERDALRALLREAREEIRDVRNDLTFAPTMQDRLDALLDRIDAALKGDDSA